MTFSKVSFSDLPGNDYLDHPNSFEKVTLVCFQNLLLLFYFLTSSSDEENEDYDKVQNTEAQPSTSSAVKTLDFDCEEESQQNTSM